VRGDLLLASLTDFPDHLGQVETVFLGDTAEPHPVTAFRRHRGQLILSLANCPDRDTADQYRGQIVQIQPQAAAPLASGQYYHHDIIGLDAVTAEGEHLGQVVEIIQTGANDVYVVRGEQGEILLPAIRSVILDINLTDRQIKVHLLDGLR
jgi:16S rRNA processing protein RimM